MNKQELMNLIDDKITEVLIEYQTSQGTDGDIEPLELLKFINLEEKLCDFIIEHWQKKE